MSRVIMYFLLFAMAAGAIHFLASRGCPWLEQVIAGRELTIEKINELPPTAGGAQ